jgi:hypothetical protein
MNNTNKSKLMLMLEAFVDSTPTNTIDVAFVDAMFLLHILTNPPSTFGAVSSMILGQLCAMSTRVDFVYDTYVTSSLKQNQGDRRVAEDVYFVVISPQQKTGNVLCYHHRSRQHFADFLQLIGSINITRII